jgi:hypothetical protein
VKPELPDKYQVIPWDGNWLLLEKVPTFRPVNGHGGAGFVQESNHRTVATLPKDSRVREVERIALLDFMSRRPGISDEQRGLRMRELVKTFGLTVAAIGPGEAEGEE